MPRSLPPTPPTPTKEYEAEKARLEELAAGTGVKALGAKNMLAQLSSGPLADELNKVLVSPKGLRGRDEEGAWCN